MKKRKLEMILEKVKGFERPDVSREQYATPATVAAELLYFAFMNGDLAGSVVDLGCGTGVLAIGASLLGRMPACNSRRRRHAKDYRH